MGIKKAKSIGELELYHTPASLKHTNQITTVYPYLANLTIGIGYQLGYYLDYMNILFHSKGTK